MSGTPRPERVADQIQIELADILARRLKTPIRGFLTVTAVELTKDLRVARIFVSTLEAKDLEPSLATLERTKGFIRSELARRIRLRSFPELEFRADRSVEQGLRMDALLRSIERGELPSTPDEDESRT